MVTSDTNTRTSNIQEVCWSEVSSDIEKSNLELFQILKSIDPEEKYTLIKVRYPFGAQILDQGVLYLPHQKGEYIPMTSSRFDERFRKKLTYTSIPLALFLNKGSEVFVHMNNRLVPLNLLEPGSVLFGLLETVGFLSGVMTSPPWSVTAGARSLFMLPKITERTKHRRLQKQFNIPPTPPHSLGEQWNTFVGIANHEKYIDQWSCDVLYFTNSWFEQGNKKMERFYHFLFQQYYKRTAYLINETEMHLTWQHLSAILSKRNLKPRPYLVDTLKHIIALADSALPGFSLNDVSERLAPTKIIQKEYVETYGLSKYFPTLILPYKFGFCGEMKPVYYSLAFPTLVEAIPDYRTPIPIIDDIRALKLMIETLCSALEKKIISSSQIGRAIANKIFKFFHTGGDIYGEILDSTHIVIDDSTLLIHEQNDNQTEFCTSGPFLSGVISISSQTS